MSYHYILHPKAQEDYESSLDWYLRRSQQAAENFVISIDNTLQLICNNPNRWRNEYKNYHELGVKKYPYIIVYTIEEDQELIFVSAIHHAKKHPKKKFRK